MKIGTKIYVIENYEVREYQLDSITATMYSLRHEDGRILKINKHHINSDIKNKYFYSKIIALNVLEEDLDNALLKVRIIIKKHKENYFSKETTTIKEIGREVFDYNARDVQDELNKI